MPSIPTPISALRMLSRLSASTQRTFKPLTCSHFQPRHTVPPFTSRFVRHNSTSTSTSTTSETPSTTPAQHTPNFKSSHTPTRHNKPTTTRPPQPEYELTFTCKPCSTRSTHRVSKQGYHHGSVLITCPECRNRHVISDHLGIFGDRNLTIEDLMRERGQLVKKGTLSEDGDVEFWEDGSRNRRGEGGGVKGEEEVKE